MANKTKTTSLENTKSEQLKSSFVTTQALSPNANTLGQISDAHTGPAPKDERLRPLLEWKTLKNTKPYLYVAILAKMGWREGKEVTESEYMKALASLRG